MQTQYEQVAQSFVSPKSLTGAIAGGVGAGVGIGTIGGPAGAIIGGAAGGAYGAALATQNKPVNLLPWLAAAVGFIVVMYIIAQMMRQQRKC